MTDYGFAARMVKMAPSQKRLATLRADRAAAYIRPGKQMAKIKSQGNITSRRSIAAVTGLALAWLVTPPPAVAQNAYITNQGVYPNFSNSVTVIDTTTNKVVTTIDVGLAPAGVAVTLDGSKVYVANEAVKGTVSVIDTATNAVSATVAVGSNPVGVAVTLDGSKVYVGNKGRAGTVSVIDTATNSVSTTIDVGLTPIGVAVTPDGSKVYVANDAVNGTVSVIDTATNSVSKTVAVGRHPVGIAVKPDGSKVYVANRGNGNV
jgi:YVTN family beta-propeller protein